MANVRQTKTIEFLRTCVLNHPGILDLSIDTDGDGFISAAEFKERFALHGHDLTDEQIEDIKTVVDDDGDGNISTAELTRFSDITLKQGQAEAARAEAASKTASNKRARSTFVLVNCQFGSDGDADKLVAHLTSPGGPGIDCVDTHGITCLVQAGLAGRPETVKALQDAGANKNIDAKRGVKIHHVQVEPGDTFDKIMVKKAA